MGRRNKKLVLPGLLIETLPSGNTRYRVRQEGKPNNKINIPVTPDHKQFYEFYTAARRGIKLKLDDIEKDLTIKGSLGWLIKRYLAYLQKQVDLGFNSPLTLKKYNTLCDNLLKKYADYDLNMPPKAVKIIRDELSDKPSMADATVVALRVMYKWAIEEDITDQNPTLTIRRIDKGKGGAKPWSIDDLNRFKTHYPLGTKQHLALSLFMFTACRISDVVWLGFEQQRMIDGIKALAWQPRKKGSSFVTIPILKPLQNAIDCLNRKEGVYLLRQDGKPYSSPDAFGQHFREWCKEAGLIDRSPHGIRKAAGNLLAQAGYSQYQIMAIHGHSQAETSEVYTKGVDRWQLAKDAAQGLNNIKW